MMKLKYFLPVKSLFERGKHIEDVMQESITLVEHIERESRHSASYFQEQWSRQRVMQLRAMENESEREMKKHVEDLVSLEDKLREAQ